jgi:undecaprenyl-diphosphatase
MNHFDLKILLYLNHLMQQSPVLAKVIIGVYGNELKTGVFVALLWWAWFGGYDVNDQKLTREKLASGVLGSILCVIVVRLMTILFPFRLRPLSQHLEGITFPPSSENWFRWSSFPSDHAALFFLLTVCLFSISWRVGTIALVDAVFLICLPRVFMGVHFPTDIIGGALIGVAGACLFLSKRVRGPLSRPMLLWMDAHPPSFYGCAFLVTFLIASVFWPVSSFFVGILRFFQLLIK